jgi:hypothetical protein
MQCCAAGRLAEKIQNMKGKASQKGAQPDANTENDETAGATTKQAQPLAVEDRLTQLMRQRQMHIQSVALATMTVWKQDGNEARKGGLPQKEESVD